MAINAEQILGEMVGAVKGVVGDRWPAIQTLAEDELEDLANVLARIEARKLAGTISDIEAKALLKIHKNTVENVLSSIEGMGLIMAEMAVNAAMGVIRDAVNAAVGFDLV